MNDMRQVDHDQEEFLLSAYLDDELETDDILRIESHLAGCAACSRKLVDLRRVSDLTQSLRIKEPPPEEWETFWVSLYNRRERSLGWLLLCLAIIVCGGFGLYQAVVGLFQAEALPWYVKGGILTGCGGVMPLLVSAIRERIFTRRRTRDDQVKR